MLLRTASDIAWRVLVVAAAVIALGYALARLRLVVLPVFFALLITAMLAPLVAALERLGVKRAIATALMFIASAVLVVGMVVLIAPRVAREFSGLGETVSAGVDDVERWLTEGPLDIDPGKLAEYRSQAASTIGNLVRSSPTGLLAGAVAVVEAVAGTILAFVLSIFFVKDGRRFQEWALAHTPERHREIVGACARRAWTALGGYLRGAAAIGTLEAVIIGLTLWLVGATLVVPVMVLTLVGAFFPIVGATVAGIIAVLVALVSGGGSDALIVAAVALAVQQFDNDLLAPLIYGRMIRLHPAVVLLTIAAGGTLGGIAGAFVAVPLAAVTGAVTSELWDRHGDRWVDSAG